MKILELVLDGGTPRRPKSSECTFLSGHADFSLLGSPCKEKELDSKKYLVITLDGCLKVNAHSFSLAPKVVGVPALLGRLFPNIGGPGNKVRYLYTQLIKSMTLYGSSI